MASTARPAQGSGWVERTAPRAGTPGPAANKGTKEGKKPRLEYEDVMAGIKRPGQEDSLIKKEGDAGADEPVEGLLGKRPRKTRATFKETHLLAKNGLWMLYKEFQELPLGRTEATVVRITAGDLAALLLVLTTSSAVRIPCSSSAVRRLRT